MAQLLDRAAAAVPLPKLTTSVLATRPCLSLSSLSSSITCVCVCVRARV